MAEVYATKTGDWSDDTVWNTGTAPTSSDDVYSNTYTVTIDEDVTVLSIRNTSGTTASAGGTFNITSGGISVSCTGDGFVFDTALLMTVSNSSGTVTLTGDVSPVGGNTADGITISGSGGVDIVGNVTGHGGGNSAAIGAVEIASAATVTITGNVYGGSGGVFHYGVYMRTGSPTVTVTGDVIGGSASTARGIRQTSGTLVVNGNVTAGGIADAEGVFHDSATLTVNGNITASQTANGVGANPEATLIHNGNMIAAVNGMQAVWSGKVLIDDTATMTHTYRENNAGSAGDERTLSTAGADQADPADVRSGTSYNQGASTGTLAVPDAAYVSLGVPVDATVGTLTGASLASGTAQGGTSTTIQLAASETFGDDILNGNIVKITGGTGAGQSRRITDYVGSTDTATVNEAWATNPDNTSTYEVVEGSHVTGISAAEVNAEVVDVINVDTLVAGVTVAEALRRIGAVCSYKISGAGSGTETVTPWDDGAETIVFTVDSSGNRTAVTFN